MGKKKFGIMGNGYLAGIIVDSYLSGILDEYQLVGVMGRTPDKTAALAERGGCKACGTVEELLALKPDIVAEAASVQCIKDNAETVLSSGADLIVLSIGAFADKALYDKIKETATEHDTKVHIASGAVGGFDVLRTVSLMGQAKSGICTRKGPASLKNTPLYDDCLMTEEEERQAGFLRQCQRGNLHTAHQGECCGGRVPGNHRTRGHQREHFQRARNDRG